MMQPDDSSTISLLNGEALPADLAHELIGIQLGVFLASVCHVLLVITEGIYDTDMWHLILTEAKTYADALSAIGQLVTNNDLVNVVIYGKPFGSTYRRRDINIVMAHSKSLNQSKIAGSDTGLLLWVLSMNCHSFAKTVSERERLRNCSQIWESVKNSPVFSIRTLQSWGMLEASNRCSHPVY
ncbi:hypothetical protein IFM89_027825 [Coptis chinensis]|uniref:Uncharacterized protein n=1 Tax=Coptis chinensis TaxID=261450 RepID=A0A835MDS1_9MAGN|nr:hypothetical protein IFM89_027825 [Coptis chinensis]